MLDIDASLEIFLLAHRPSLSEKVSMMAATWIHVKFYVQESRPKASRLAHLPLNST